MGEFYTQIRKGPIAKCICCGTPVCLYVSYIYSSYCVHLSVVKCRHNISHGSRVASLVVGVYVSCLLLLSSVYVRYIKSPFCSWTSTACAHFGSCSWCYSSVFLYFVPSCLRLCFQHSLFTVFMLLTFVCCACSTRYEGMALRCLIWEQVLHDCVFSLCFVLSDHIL